VLLVIAPVSIRNSILAREFTLTTSQAGQNLYIGNSPYNTTGQYQAPPWVRPNPEFERPDFAEYADKTSGRTLTYAGVSRFYIRAALNWVRSRPADFTRLLWRKTVLYFNNFEVPDNQDIYFFSRYSWVLRLPLLSFGLVFALGLAAMILLARGLDRLSMVVVFFGYAASVVAFFVFSRYRIPALPAILPFAGAMLPWFADHYRPHPSSRAPRPAFPGKLAGGLALILAAIALTLYPVHHGSGKTEAAQSLTNLASIYFHEGDSARAVATYEEALATQPGHAEASRNLGIIMLNRGSIDRALHLLSDAARADPANPSTHVHLGRLHQRQGRLQAADLEFRKAVALAPGRVEFRFELATNLQQLDNYPQALAQYDTMIQLAPDNPVVRHNYSVCLYNIGRLDDARVQLEEARRLGGPVNPRFDSLLKAGRSPTP
jgi:tetratricopeptide (TPR) repeat protein